MGKEELQERVNQLEETYKKTVNQINKLQEQKLRIEGQYTAYKQMLEEDTEENIKEIGE